MGDSTAIWFFQEFRGMEYRIIDYYEASGVGLPHYARVLEQKKYAYGRHIAPHDINVRELGSGQSRLETARMLGIRFEVAPNLPLQDGIDAARILLAKCWFDKKKTDHGLEALRLYRREFNDKANDFKPHPIHDWTSHAADAFRYLAVGYRPKVAILPGRNRAYTGSPFLKQPKRAYA